MLKTFEILKDFEETKKHNISFFDDEQIGKYTTYDCATIRGLIKIFHMISIYDNNGDLSIRNMDKKEWIYCILKDAERELKNIYDDVDITSSLEEDVREIRKIICG